MGTLDWQRKHWPCHLKPEVSIWYQPRLLSGPSNSQTPFLATFVRQNPKAPPNWLPEGADCLLRPDPRVRLAQAWAGSGPFWTQTPSKVKFWPSKKGVKTRSKITKKWSKIDQILTLFLDFDPDQLQILTSFEPKSRKRAQNSLPEGVHPTPWKTLSWLSTGPDPKNFGKSEIFEISDFSIRPKWPKCLEHW